MVDYMRFCFELEQRRFFMYFIISNKIENTQRRFLIMELSIFLNVYLVIKVIYRVL